MSIFDTRLGKVRQQMEARGIELLFLSPSPYMFYATGIPERPYFGVIKVPGDWLSGVFISADRGPVFMAYWMLARHAQLGDNTVTEMRILEQGKDPYALLTSVLAEFRLSQKRVAVGDNTCARFVQALQSVVPGVNLSMASEFMDPLLAVKDEEAIRRMRQIGEITDAAYQEVLKHLHLGITQEEVALEVDYQLRQLGSEANSFETGIYIVRPGDKPEAAIKHLQPGDSVAFDFGGVWGNYSSDYGRCVFAGDPPAEYLKAHELVLRAQAEGMKAMKPGQITCEEVDAIARKVIADEGYGPNFTHRLGHGIGITVHERPFLDAGDTTVLQAGMTFTVEPSIRVPGRFTNRVEDVVLVTEEGGQYLTTYPRTLHIVC